MGFFQTVIFLNFFLVKMWQRKVFGAVLHRERGFLDDKNID